MYSHHQALSIEINIGATFHNLSFDVPILKDGVSLTSVEFHRILIMAIHSRNTSPY